MKYYHSKPKSGQPHEYIEAVDNNRLVKRYINDNSIDDDKYREVCLTTAMTANSLVTRLFLSDFNGAVQKDYGHTYTEISQAEAMMRILE